MTGSPFSAFFGSVKKRKDLFRIADANEAVASVAFRLSEIIAIYPITPSSPMADHCDEWAARGMANLWGDRPDLVEMQSEAGVAGAIHGALQAGSIATTFTASQGLLLMMPNMFKIAGELLPFCMHVAARSIATHGLSIFGDHSDVMACRTTGFAMMASNSVQEAQDFAAIATAATFRSRVPFLHFFDGFRTSHEINGYELLTDEVLRRLVDRRDIEAFRRRAITPDRPTIRGTAQNPDVFFQCRERANPFYRDLPDMVADGFDRFRKLTGRDYHLFDYVGAADAETVFVTMGSAAETIEETIGALNEAGARLGLVKVRLYRPFSLVHFCDALPRTARSLIVMDRTKEAGSIGEPLFLDVVAALTDGRREGKLPSSFLPAVHGGRYGLGSKEFSPAMVSGIVDRLRSGLLDGHFTIGIEDDLTSLSVPYDREFRLRSDRETFGALFFGLGSDGTVGANKNTIKIIGDETDNFAQAYFVYDSKKSGAMTVSHLRFGPRPIRAPYLVESAQFVGCHQFSFLGKYDVLRQAAPRSTLLINCPHPLAEVQSHLPPEVCRRILDLELAVYCIDAYGLAREYGMGRHINTIMQTCFFAISGILPQERALAAIKGHIEQTYGRKGSEVIGRNFACVDAALAHLHRLELSPDRSCAGRERRTTANLPKFIRDVTLPLLENRGDELPVGCFPADGTWPTGTTRLEKRRIATEIPRWDPAICIQCNKCAFVCPHAAIRAKCYDRDRAVDRPKTFRSAPFRSRDLTDYDYTIQVAPEDCTGCGLCVDRCPAKDRTNPERKAINMTPIGEILDQERENFAYFLDLPNPPAAQLTADVKGSQFAPPLFEYSGACAGCGETPYLKLLTQLFGDRLLIANATGCSSIYGGNLPTTPYCQNGEGRGPAWANSLFEDNAEFGLGMLLSVERQERQVRRLLEENGHLLDGSLVQSILTSHQGSAAEVQDQRFRIDRLRREIDEQKADPEGPLALLHRLADGLVKKSLWIVGGDGWAYDIGYGGLDHVLASGKRVKILVLDTEVYSNTGGQQSKATPRGAVAKFAASGKSSAKKDLGAIAMAYGNIYVAQIAFGANDSQTVNAFLEAESYDGPALLIAYAPCIAHGYDLSHQLEHQRLAVETGYWPLYRFDPRRKEPLRLDSKKPSRQLAAFLETENRFTLLQRMDAERAADLEARTQRSILERFGEGETS